tara:strand:- start:103 stop:282 length:180 start_codon:yes stop_codon:yes gene_type:complete
VPVGVLVEARVLSWARVVMAADLLAAVVELLVGMGPHQAMAAADLHSAWAMFLVLELEA